jgi:hypothetical protein
MEPTMKRETHVDTLSMRAKGKTPQLRKSKKNRCLLKARTNTLASMSTADSWLRLACLISARVEMSGCDGQPIALAFLLFYFIRKCLLIAKNVSANYARYSTLLLFIARERVLHHAGFIQRTVGSSCSRFLASA